MLVTIRAVALSANAHSYSPAQSTQEVQQLFAELQNPPRSDATFGRLKSLAERSGDARQYLTINLPRLIATTSQGPVFLNAVRLACDLKIAETAPVLANLLDYENRGGTITFAEADRLDDDPVGKALAEFGEPALGLVRGILENKNKSQATRLRAALILYNMNSTDADQVLAHQLQTESDPRVKKSIEVRLNARNKTPSH